MKLDAKIMSFLTDLAQTAFATAFLTVWLICCIVVALFSRIAAVSDLLTKRLCTGSAEILKSERE